jgi:hypothetical protein
MSLQVNNLVGLSYNPNDIRFGNTDSIQYLFERRRNQAILQGSLRLFQLQIDYANSYLNIPTFTVLAYRDLLLSIALSMAARCAQSRDILYLELTSHAKKYWERYGNNFWDAVPLYEDDPNFSPDSGFYGVAGSLAFWMYKHQDTGQGLYPTQLLERMLSYFWSDLGVDPSLPAALLQDSLFSKLQIANVPLSAYENMFTKIVSSQINSLPNWQAAIVLALRRNLLTIADWESLRSRWILNEINPLLVSVIHDMSIPIGNEAAALGVYEAAIPVNNFADQLLTIAPPAGMPLVYIALTVQGLVAAINFINSLSDLYDVPFTDFIDRDVYADLRYQIALQLATAHDALGALGMFNTLYEASGLSYRILIAITQLTDQTIPQDGTTRLYRFLWP